MVIKRAVTITVLLAAVAVVVVNITVARLPAMPPADGK
jgi:hypothetical protein